MLSLITTKVCARCNTECAKTNFYPHKHTKDKLNSWCKQCSNVATSVSRKKEPKTVFNYLKRKMWAIKREAKLRGIGFEITIDDVIELYGKQKGLCALSGEQLTWIYGNNQGQVLTNLSVDRIDSALDYTKDNIQLVCYIVNSMKNILTKDELLLWCNKIITYKKEN